MEAPDSGSVGGSSMKDSHEEKRESSQSRKRPISEVEGSHAGEGSSSKVKLSPGGAPHHHRHRGHSQSSESHGGSVGGAGGGESHDRGASSERKLKEGGGTGRGGDESRRRSLSPAPPQRTGEWNPPRSIDRYQDLQIIGGGTYGTVFRAYDPEDKCFVAIKEVKQLNEREGIPITAIREIKFLKQINHVNVVRLKEVIADKNTNKKVDKKEVNKREKEVTVEAAGGGKKGMENTPVNIMDGKVMVYMVFEHLEYDLSGLLDQRYLQREHVQQYMKQLLTAFHYMHANKIIHRDVKTANILVSADHILKVADFGLARRMPDDDMTTMTNLVVTRWYRSPELCLGAKRYDGCVDMWSIGCIFAEMLLGKPVFKGNDDAEMLKLIFGVCGRPTKEDWPEHVSLPVYTHVNKDHWPEGSGNFHTLFGKEVKEKHGDKAVDLLWNLLQLNPQKRYTPSKALDHDYFWKHPLPTDPAKLPPFPVKYMNEHMSRELRSKDRK